MGDAIYRVLASQATASRFPGCERLGAADPFALVAHLTRLAGPRPCVVVAFSGGIDSTVLAHALTKQRRKFGGLRLVHVDHGLQAASGEWARHCASVARRLRVPFVALSANVQRKRGESPEAAAREARYALLAKAMKPGEVLVTAQHRDDQVETLLLQLFRGAGVAGLAAMPAIAPFGPGRIARPLLGTSRAELEAYAKVHRLRWVEDPTNMETQFARNFLRARYCPSFASNGSVPMRPSRAARATWRRLTSCSVRWGTPISRAPPMVMASASRRCVRCPGAAPKCAARLHRALWDRSAVHGPDDGDRRQPAGRASRCAARGALARRRHAPARRPAGT